jgi:metal-responsive CopG/Arc/MetJ family transcriptional regulator
MPNQTKRRILNISLPSELYNDVEELAKRQAKTKGEFAREVLRQYIEGDKRWRQIRKWGEETAYRLGIKDERDVERIIDEYREESERELPLK